MKSLFYGREILKSELPKKFKFDLNTVNTIASTVEKTGKIYCGRCQSLMTPIESQNCSCQKSCSYCRNCIQMGKVKQCQPFYNLSEPNFFENKDQDLLAWNGELSTQQKEASENIIETIHKKQTRLLWAVAGAGKTEMLFEGIEWALQRNQRVCIASPRVDVCLELAPRIAAAFPKTPLAVLYGGMEEPYAYTQLVIGTTHQLFRFREAFDVLIIDEIDAFPFHSDAPLQFAAEKARKKESALIYLSATPSGKMQKEVTKNKLLATILPARYHGHGLPMPKTIRCRNWQKRLLKRPLKTSFGKAFDQRIKKKQKFLVFAPNIEWMGKFEQVVQGLYPDISFETVSAEDPLRKEKVLKMREDKVQFLIVSTILERGVTFPNVDVLVIGAEDRIFTESALVQIAGRAGRSPKYPTGDVLFFHDGQTIAIKKALKQIKNMNDLAKKRGLIE